MRLLKAHTKTTYSLLPFFLSSLLPFFPSSLLPFFPCMQSLATHRKMTAFKIGNFNRPRLVELFAPSEGF